jgi:type IX secretion system substrate protein
MVKMECSAFNNKTGMALRIMDAAGKEVLKSKIEKSSSETYLDVSALKNGTYFISIAPDGSVISSKFVKQ